MKEHKNCRNTFGCISDNTRHYVSDDKEEKKVKTKHKHHHDEECCCEHEHEHHHDEECCCEHKHHHDEGCCCGHHHDHDHDECDCGCGCGHSHSHSKKDRIILLSRVGISLIILVIAFFIKNPIVNSVLLGISYIVVAYDILFNAFKNIIKGKVFDENFLMSLASLTALIVYFINKDAGIDGYDGVLVILLYQVGEFFQHFAADKSKESITKMLEVDIDKVVKVEGKNHITIEAKNIQIDDIILVKPGETVPTDGIIVSGSSSFNTSSLTGESKPYFAGVNDKVLSGYINNDGVITFKAVTTYENSTSSKVKKVIEEASKNPAKGERFITKFAKIYTPIVIFVALFVAFIIPLILGFDEYFITYLYKGLAIMVISCPCALVISIPLSYFIGLGKSAKNAILVKGASYLENLATMDAIAFDKTGTLTKGNFKVTHFKSDNEELMSKLLYSCEKNFTHPIATSITTYLKNNTEEVEIDELENIPGYGLKATYNAKKVLVGNYKLLKENDVDVKQVAESGTVIYVSYDNSYLGYLLIEDEIKEDAKDTLNKLSSKYETYLISGDSKDIAFKVANELNIKNVSYEVLPDEKVNIVSKIKENKKIVYVGDGVNDAACLLKADVGVAMKSLGSDIAISASDIVIMDDKISSVDKAINISKKTMRIVKQNIVASIAIKVLVMILAMIIKVPMFVAIIADVGVCLLAILNSLRIMYGKISK